MRHVDEGLLHAWIDGAFEAGTPEREEIEAHLAGCADCRVRLDDARRVRDVAQDVLDAAAPSESAAPSWDTIVAEHARRRESAGGAAPAPVPGRSTRPRIPLAWAASLILAVGAGWMGRAMLAERALAPAPQEMASSVDALEDLDAAALRQEAATTPAAGAPANEPPAPIAARRDGTAEAAPSAVTVDESRLRERVTAVSPPEAQRFSDERAAAAKAAAPRAAANLGRSLAADAAAGIAPIMPAAPLADAADSVAGRWVAADSQAVAAALGAPPLVAAGLVPDTVQLGTADGVPIARSVFVLADGVVEMLQRAMPLSDEAPAAREAESVVTQSTLTLRGIEVLIRGSNAAAVGEVRGRLR